MKQKKKDWSKELTEEDKSLLKEIRKGKLESALDQSDDSFEYDYGKYGTTSTSNVDYNQHKQMKAKEDAILLELIKKKVPEIVNSFYILGKNRLDLLARKLRRDYSKQIKLDLNDYLNQNIWANREMLAKEFDFEALVLNQFERYDILNYPSLANMLSKSKIKIIGAVRALSGSKYIKQIEGQTGEYAQFEITEAGKKALSETYKQVDKK